MILVLICKSIGFTSQKYTFYIATVYLLHRNSIPFTSQQYTFYTAEVLHLERKWALLFRSDQLFSTRQKLPQN